jgi:acetylglutamate kinase
MADGRSLLKILGADERTHGAVAKLLRALAALKALFARASIVKPERPRRLWQKDDMFDMLGSGVRPGTAGTREPARQGPLPRS